jgi:hypothetical protein
MNKINFLKDLFYSFSSTYTLYIKLVVLPRNIDFAKDRDFWAALYPFLFQLAFRAFFLDFDVRFLGTAIISYLLLFVNIFSLIIH